MKMKKVSQINALFVLGDIEDNTICREINKCKHIFHIGCADRWFKNNLKCPHTSGHKRRDKLIFFDFLTLLQFLSLLFLRLFFFFYISSS